MKRIFIFSIGCYLTLCFSAAACGPYFPNSYIIFGGEHLLDLPEVSLDCEISRVLSEMNIAVSETNRTDSTEGYDVRVVEELAGRTLSVDERELYQALPAEVNRESICRRYAEMRKAMLDFGVAKFHEPMRQYEQQFQEQENTEEEPAPLPASFNLAPYESLLQELPAEFSIYVRGAAAYHGKDYSKAIEHFSAVLALPPDQRLCRTTWAAFMLGKSWFWKERAKSIPFFEQARQLAAEGFSDPCNLAKDSIGWQARAETDSGAYVQAIHHYCEFYQVPEFSYVAFESLRWACGRALDAEASYPELAKDPLCRRLLMATFFHSFSVDRTQQTASLSPTAKRWMDAIAGVDASNPFPDADRIAWVLYQEGMMDDAAKWLERADVNSPLSQWVRAKILLHAGKFDEGSAALDSIAALFSEKNDWGVDDGAEGWYKVSKVSRAEYGMACLAAKNYDGALTGFIQAGFWEDAAFVAERVMTSGELARFIEANAAVPEFQRQPASPYDNHQHPSVLEMLRYLLARKLAREGAWEKAIPYYPTDYSVFFRLARKPEGFLTKQAQAMVEHLAAGKNSKISARERAQHYFDAAETLNMELVGFETGPDWNCWGGQFDLGDEAKIRKNIAASLPGVQIDEARLNASQAKPDERFHYRYAAADLMWKCAALLPDNDLLTARALYAGGTYIQNNDPKAADRFYKALVRRNRRLPIAQEADKLRWFPKTFNENLSNEPAPEPTEDKNAPAGSK